MVIHTADWRLQVVVVDLNATPRCLSGNTCVGKAYAFCNVTGVNNAFFWTVAASTLPPAKVRVATVVNSAALR